MDFNYDYKPFDEIRRLTRLPFSWLQRVHGQFTRRINPYGNPALWAVNKDVFADVFDMQRSVALTSTFKVFARSNGLIDMLEVFAGIAIICSGPEEDKLRFLFGLFDFGGKGELSEDEMTMLLDAVGGGFNRLGLMPNFRDDDIEYMTASVFTEESMESMGGGGGEGGGGLAGQTMAALQVDGFIEWMTTSEHPAQLVDQLKCVPMVEAVLGSLKRQIQALHALHQDPYGPQDLDGAPSTGGVGGGEAERDRDGAAEGGPASAASAASTAADPSLSSNGRSHRQGRRRRAVPYAFQHPTIKSYDAALRRDREGYNRSVTEPVTYHPYRRRARGHIFDPAALAFDEEVRVLVGPVVGHVDTDSAVILLEVRACQERGVGGGGTCSETDT